MDKSGTPNEDLRGVDLGQIRHLLKLSVKDRVSEMVDAANVMIKIQDDSRRAREANTN